MRLPSGACLVVVGLTLMVACSEPTRTPTTPTAPSPPTGTTPPGGTDPPPGPPPTPPPSTLTGRTVTMVAVADIGECGSAGVPLAARIAERIDGEMVLAGDLAYMQGSMQDYLRCFDPFWGQFRRRWRPTPGNHEYETPGAAGYFQYFGDVAAPAGRSYYAFRTGDWLVLMLDSNISTQMASAQYEFVRSQMAATPLPCTMAVFHHPLFSSGPNGPNIFMRDMWGLLYAQNADVVVAGHDHFYERFGKQDVDGRSDPRGLRQFIAGTGGAGLYNFLRMTPNSQARVKAHGVLRLTLHSNGYEWAFLETGGAIGDSGSDGCH
ncbi:MAG: metallophosphoesterase family protein [Acidobacteriota bacterium]